MDLHIEQSNDTTAALGVDWRTLLDEETPRLDAFGLASGIITVTIDEELALPLSAATRVDNLLSHIVIGTDRAHRVARDTFGVLVTPLGGLVELREKADRIAQKLDDAGLSCTLGWAMRRFDEHLLDTSARADAEVDRLKFSLARHR